jgi:pSer/pThr/pTyr-binding forkhead associated (FHA) protein
MSTLVQLIDDVVANKFDLNGEQLTIGRHGDNNIQIDDISVSGHHAVIRQQKSDYLDGVVEVFVEDLGSTNGTFLNGNKVEGPTRLSNNDVLRLAWNDFKFVDDSQNALEGTAHILQE